ncbi:MAG: hypothetical protein H6Q72_4188 [Firmicutes bacterium]|nr:hypothetical protein [Bacillota bacterium]
MDKWMLDERSQFLLKKIYDEQYNSGSDMTNLRASKLNWELKDFAEVVDYLRIHGLITNIDFDGNVYYDTSLDKATITQAGIDNLKALGIID